MMIGRPGRAQGSDDGRRRSDSHAGGAGRRRGLRRPYDAVGCRGRRVVTSSRRCWWRVAHRNVECRRSDPWRGATTNATKTNDHELRRAARPVQTQPGGTAESRPAPHTTVRTVSALRSPRIRWDAFAILARRPRRPGSGGAARAGRSFARPGRSPSNPTRRRPRMLSASSPTCSTQLDHWIRCPENGLKTEHICDTHRSPCRARDSARRDVSEVRLTTTCLVSTVE
jgi:hypothetical protein